jgi:hypothetical protein
MTDPAASPLLRIVGSPDDGPESYVPISGPRHLAVLQRLAEGPTAQERERWAREEVRREAERREVLGRSIARHVALVDEHSDHPVLNTLLAAHGPCLAESSDGRQYAECHGCPAYWVDAPSGEPYEEHHEWPCPTWTTIAEQTS